MKPYEWNRTGTPNMYAMLSRGIFKKTLGYAWRNGSRWEACKLGVWEKPRYLTRRECGDWLWERR